MIIRCEQLQTLKAYAEGAFATEMVEHLKSYAPKVCEVVGDLGIRRIVESEIQHARGYGFSNRGPVRFFLELTCSLGCGFDTDPQLRWAAETLNDGFIQNDMLRADHLYERMVMYLDRVFGPDQQYAIQALQRWLEVDFEMAPREEWSEKPVLKLMAHLYPEKFEFVGESVASTLVQQATAEAVKYDLPQGKGAAALAGMKFAMGHRICEDHYYPWVSSALKDPRIVDGERRLARLISKMRTYGTHVLAYFTQS
jgi:hypothetical protein